MAPRGWAGVAIALAVAGCGGEDEAAAPAARATATPAPTVTAVSPAAPRPDTRRRRFRTVAEAVDAVESLVDVPVVVPAKLPEAVGGVSAGGSRGRGYISLLLAKRRALQLDYGRAGFDGCGPLNPRATTVGGTPAVINASDGSRPPYVTLVWPATVKKPTGRYGVSGQFPEARIMAWAESMQERARAAEPGRHTPGC